MDHNLVLISGRVTAVPPSLKYTKKGTAILSFDIYTKRIRHSYDEVGAPYFFRIIAWGTLAEKFKDLKKGDSVLIRGRLEQQVYGTEDEKKSRIVIVADEIYYMGQKDEYYEEQEEGEIF